MTNLFILCAWLDLGTDHFCGSSSFLNFDHDPGEGGEEGRRGGREEGTSGGGEVGYEPDKVHLVY